MHTAMDIKYEAGHTYREQWEPTKLRCPQCGEQSIWHERSSEDYYVGEQHLCVICGSGFTIQGPYEATGWQNEQRLRGINEGLHMPQM